MGKLFMTLHRIQCTMYCTLTVEIACVALPSPFYISDSSHVAFVFAGPYHRRAVTMPTAVVNIDV